MNPQAYELWSEHFSGMIRMNRRWDWYDRIALELFRKKQPTLKVMEFGFTQQTSDWSNDRCFTQQMAWMVENGYAECLAVTDWPGAVGKDVGKYKGLKILVPLHGPENPPINYFNAVISGFQINQADLILFGEKVDGIYLWSTLKPGCLVAIEGDAAPGFSESLGFTKVYGGPLSLWRKK